MLNCGLLLIYSPLNKVSSRIGHFLNEAKTVVGQVLYIHVERSSLDEPSDVDARNQHEDDYHHYLPSIYRAASVKVPNLDVRVVIKPQLTRLRYQPQILLCNHPLDQKNTKILPSSISGKFDISRIKEIKIIPDAKEDIPAASSEKYSPKINQHDHVCLGGTFDNLHNGHKVLLSEALIRTRKSLTIGITDTNMIQKKVLWELIKPVEERIAELKDYLVDVCDQITYKIVPINDPFGPAIADNQLSCIVVSEETLRGGEKINLIRQEKKMSKLEIICTGLVKEETKQCDIEDDKVSSSSARIRRLGTIWRQPSPRPNLPKQPYRIGLTGGIASGKSSICKKLAELGAGTVNADLLAHETYSTPQSVAYSKLIETFGSHIVSPGDSKIDRKKLAAVVFSDKSKLSQLNSIIWPATEELMEKRIKELQANHDIVVVEAALLLEAGWDQKFHQIWVSIITEDEAIRRLKTRNNMEEEEAKKRIKSQMTNVDRVKRANIIFSTLWEEKFTYQQIEKAFKLLRKDFVKC